MYVQVVTYLLILFIGAGIGAWAGFRYGERRATRILGNATTRGHRNAIRAWRERS
jgi:hypothetical protein